MRRLELIHDVLTRVVMDSRDKRHAREQRDRAERELQGEQRKAQAQAEQAKREREFQGEQEKAKVQAKHARRMGWLASIIGLLAVGASIFGVLTLDAIQQAK